MRNLLYFLFVFDLFSNQSQMVCYKVEIKHRICIFVCVFFNCLSLLLPPHKGGRKAARNESQYNGAGSVLLHIYDSSAFRLIYFFLFFCRGCPLSVKHFGMSQRHGQLVFPCVSIYLYIY